MLVSSLQESFDNFPLTGNALLISNYTTFRLAYRSPHFRFGGDICITAQTPLAAEGRPSVKQCQVSIDNLTALPTVADRRQLTSIQLGSDVAW